MATESEASGITSRAALWKRMLRRELRLVHALGLEVNQGAFVGGMSLGIRPPARLAISFPSLRGKNGRWTRERSRMFVAEQAIIRK